MGVTITAAIQQLLLTPTIGIPSPTTARDPHRDQIPILQHNPLSDLLSPHQSLSHPRRNALRQRLGHVMTVGVQAVRPDVAMTDHILEYFVRLLVGVWDPALWVLVLCW